MKKIKDDIFCQFGCGLILEVLHYKEGQSLMELVQTCEIPRLSKISLTS
jgi:hypothetical protein